MLGSLDLPSALSIVSGGTTDKKRVLGFRSSFFASQAYESFGLCRNKVLQIASPASFARFHDYHWGQGEVENEPRESGY